MKPAGLFVNARESPAARPWPIRALTAQDVQVGFSCVLEYLKWTGTDERWPQKEVPIMCPDERGCEKSEKCPDSPAECTPEQIKECHGDEDGHPCCERQGD